MESRTWTTWTRRLPGAAITGLLLAGLLAPAVRVQAQATDVVSVITGFHTALNAGDLDATLAFFADTAVADIQGDVHRGTGEIRAWLERDMASNIHVEVLNLHVTGNNAAWTARLKVDEAPEPFELAASAVVEEGKITSFAALPMETPEQAVLPETGRVSLAGSRWLLALTGLGLLSLGLRLRRRPVDGQ